MHVDIAEEDADGKDPLPEYLVTAQVQFAASKRSYSAMRKQTVNSRAKIDNI